MPEPTYLGDGVYVKVDGRGRVVLTTGSYSDVEAENRIGFEPEVLIALVKYIEQMIDSDKKVG